MGARRLHRGVDFPAKADRAAARGGVTISRHMSATPQTASTSRDRSQPVRADVQARRLSVAELSPASFGIVMATGIVSIGAHLLRVPLVARGLFGVNLLVFAVLSVLTALRLVRYPSRFFADMFDHRRGPGYFTTVAGVAILGSQSLLIGGQQRPAIALFAVAGVLWLLLTYTIFAAFTIKQDKPTLEEGIGGAWLLAVVATQSLAVLAALLAARLGAPLRLPLNFFALSMWLWGGMLYIWTMALIFYRYTFFRLRPSDLTPPYWINMGAMAISTLAGALLVVDAPGAPLLDALRPFLKGFTLFYWASGTWWIPLLLVLGAWRYLYARFPLRYDAQYWSVVFPLGMYAVATHEMSQALAIEFLAPLPIFFLYAAIAAWVVVATGLGAALVQAARSNDR
jgi:tellurite resistance protein TehA-like permease